MSINAGAHGTIVFNARIKKRKTNRDRLAVPEENEPTEFDTAIDASTNHFIRSTRISPFSAALIHSSF